MLYGWTLELPGAVVTDDAWFAGEVHDAAAARHDDDAEPAEDPAS